MDESFFIVTGVLDEHVDYQALLLAPSPIRIRLGNVITVNSLGVRNFLRFIEACRDKDVELHECSLAFMDALNTRSRARSTKVSTTRSSTATRVP